MRRSVDLNCDVGEGYGDDAALIPLVSSVNIACGFHAGDTETMKRTVDLAVRYGVAVGAHPSYPDRENFGRLDMEMNAQNLADIITEQIATLDRITKEAGCAMVHVKPHGALYNRSARDPEVASVIADAVRSFDAKLVLFGLSQSHSIRSAEAFGLATRLEVFADRTYRGDGSLTPRSEDGAVITDVDAAAEQVLDMIKYGRVRTTVGTVIRIDAETVCIHGDTPGAADFAGKIRQALDKHSISISAANG